MTNPENPQMVTYFAVDATDPYGKEIILGRGNLGDPESLASEAFAAVDSTDERLHQAIVRNLATALGDQELTRANAAAVLSSALRLAELEDESTPAEKYAEFDDEYGHTEDVRLVVPRNNINKRKGVARSRLRRMGY